MEAHTLPANKWRKNWLNVDAVRTMMSAAGQKPNEAKVRQTYNQIIKQQKQALADSKKKKK